MVGPAHQAARTRTTVEQPAAAVADGPAVPASATIAGQWKANQAAQANTVCTKPASGTIFATVEGFPAAVPDLAAIVVAARSFAGQRPALYAGIFAQARHALPTGGTASGAVEVAAASISDHSTDRRIVEVTSVGVTHRGGAHADVVIADPAGFRAIPAVQGTATAVADGFTVLAGCALAGHRRAGWR